MNGIRTEIYTATYKDGTTGTFKYPKYPVMANNIVNKFLHLLWPFLYVLYIVGKRFGK